MKRARGLIDEAKRAIDHDLREALSQMPRHPIALWVQAHRASGELQSERAVSVLQRMLKILAPYDPDQLIANWSLLPKKRPTPQPHHQFSFSDTSSMISEYETTHEQLRKHETVSGWQQFAHVVSPYAIHEQLALVFTDMGRTNLCVQHLMLALTYSRHWDVDADQFLVSLVQQLDYLDRLPDAYAVIAVLRTNRRVLETNSLSIVKWYQPDIWDCIVLTQMKRYAESLAAGRVLQTRLSLTLQTITTKGVEVYQERIPEELQHSLAHSLQRAWTIFESHTQYPSAATQAGAVSPERVNALSVPNHILERSLIWFKWLAQVHKLLATNETDEHYSAIEIATRSQTVGYGTGYISDGERDVARNLLPRLDINRNITLQFLEFLAGEAINMIELRAQVQNNIAFNVIELRLHRLDHLHNQAAPETADTIAALPENAQVLVEQAIESLTQLTARKELPSRYNTRLRRALAYYYDTKGWMFYRLARFEREQTNDNLRKAQICLETALQYDQRSAVIYYHAARVQLTFLERMWQMGIQVLPPHHDVTRAYDKSEKGSIQPNLLDNYLVVVHYYWMQARKHDYSGRFAAQLAWIGVRLDQYRALWIQQQRSFDDT